MRSLPRLCAILAIVLSGTSSLVGQVKITTTSLPGGAIGASYSASISTRLGGVPFIWTVSAGSLPPGIGMTPSADTRSALFSGTPTMAGSYSFSTTVQGKGGHRSTAKYTVAISGPPSGTLSANPASLAFGNVQVGNTATLWEALTNTGGSPVTITQANVSGTGFSISGLTLPMTLAPTQSVTFTAIFTPVSAGAANGNLAVVSDAVNSSLNVALSGTGASPGVLSISPATLSFGNVTVGSSVSVTANLAATEASVRVSSASANNGQFVLSRLTLPITIPAGQSASFTVTFTPTSVGATTSTLTFISDASNSPTTQSLAGTGQAAVSHSVDLSWSVAPGAVSYNVYRKLITDSNYKKLGSADATATYADGTAASGETYDYVVTSVDAEQQESGYSNIAQVTIPTS